MIQLCLIKYRNNAKVYRSAWLDMSVSTLINWKKPFWESFLCRLEAYSVGLVPVVLNWRVRQLWNSGHSRCWSNGDVDCGGITVAFVCAYCFWFRLKTVRENCKVGKGFFQSNIFSLFKIQSKVLMVFVPVEWYWMRPNWKATVGRLISTICGEPRTTASQPEVITSG